MVFIVFFFSLSLSFFFGEVSCSIFLYFDNVIAIAINKKIALKGESSKSAGKTAIKDNEKQLAHSIALTSFNLCCK